MLSQILHHWEGKAECLAGACQVSDDKVLAFPDRLEGLVLDWEERENASGNQALSCFLGDLGESGEVPISNGFYQIVLMLHAHASGRDVRGFLRASGDASAATALFGIGS